MNRKRQFGCVSSYVTSGPFMLNSHVKAISINMDTVLISSIDLSFVPWNERKLRYLWFM